MTHEKMSAAFNAAINYALEEAGPDGLLFLRYWREGDWETIKAEFPDFDQTAIPAYSLPASTASL